MKTALQILQLLPTIIELIKAIEAAVPQGGKGSEKLQAVLDIVAGLVDNAAELMPKLTAVIGTIVGMFNAAGTFTKGTRVPGSDNEVMQ